MIQLLKRKKKNQPIFFKSYLGNFNFYFINIKIKIPQNIKINKKQNILKIKGPLGLLKFQISNLILIFLTKNYIFLILNNLKKNKILNIYQSLIKLKIKGVLQGFKLNLFLKGLGFKANINQNILNLKLGYSHPILINIPQNIKIIIQTNKIIFNSIDWVLLSQYVSFIKNHKKPEPYKGKGLLLKNEIILKKEGKKSKK